MIFNVSGGGAVLPQGGVAGQVLTKTANGTEWANAPGQPSNLLDNSDFLHFIAQGGIGGYHGTQAYAGDRWILDSGTVTGTANENGEGYSNITLNGAIRQKVASAPSVASVGIEMVSGTAAIAYADGEVTITSAGGVIRGALLCEGENLPEYQPKGYGAELAECRRYYRSSQIYNLYCYADGYLFGFGFELPMRIVPTITVVSVADATWTAVSGTTTAQAIAGGNGVSLVENTNFTNGKYYRVYMEFAADM